MIWLLADWSLQESEPSLRIAVPWPLIPWTTENEHGFIAVDEEGELFFATGVIRLHDGQGFPDWNTALYGGKAA